MAKLKTILDGLTPEDARAMRAFCFQSKELNDDTDPATRLIRRLVHATADQIDPPILDMFSNCQHDFSVADPNQPSLF